MTEIQVIYGDSSRDTFPVITGNLNSVPWFNIKDTEMVLVEDLNGTSLACSSITNDLEGKIALLDRGECMIAEKYERIASSNAIGFLMCNGLSGEPPILGNLGPPFLATGTIWKHDCDSLKLKLDAATRVSWINEYILDCDNTVLNTPSNCMNAIDLGIITNCPDITNSATITTGNRCNEEPQSGTCYSDTLGSVWVKWTMGENMSSVNVQLIGIRGSNPFLEIFEAGECGSMGPILSCFEGDSVFLIEGLNPNTTYFGLIGEQEKTADAGSFIAIRNADCKFSFKGKVFHDENKNGVWDDGEDSLSHIAFTHIKDGRKFYSTSDGTYQTSIGIGLDSIIIADEEICWMLTDSSYRAISSLDGELQTLDLGLMPTGNTDALAEVRIDAARIRCNETVSIWVTVNNIGCEPVNDDLVLVLDSLLASVNGADTILFQVIDLHGSGSALFKFELDMPDETFIGDSISLTAILGELTFEYEDILACAFDPNDKLVEPQRASPENYTLKEEEITYKIRFQNTGSDTAYSVQIIDTLSEFLDLSSIRFLSSSHNANFNLVRDVLIVEFNDIYLVDSLTNEKDSHGFVSFAIYARQEVEDFTVINNSAAIYFDRNQPIITNEVKSTLVSTFDFDEDDSPFWIDCNDDDPTVNPSAEEIPNNGIDENCDGLDLTSHAENLKRYTIDLYPNPSEGLFYITSENEAVSVQIQDLHGRTIYYNTNFLKSHRVEISSYPAGIYFVYLKSNGAVLAQVEKIIKI